MEPKFKTPLSSKTSDQVNLAFLNFHELSTIRNTGGITSFGADGTSCSSVCTDTTRGSDPNQLEQIKVGNLNIKLRKQLRAQNRSVAHWHMLKQCYQCSFMFAYWMNNIMRASKDRYRRGLWRMENMNIYDVEVGGMKSVKDEGKKDGQREGQIDFQEQGDQ